MMSHQIGLDILKGIRICFLIILCINITIGIPIESWAVRNLNIDAHITCLSPLYKGYVDNNPNLVTFPLTQEEYEKFFLDVSTLFSRYFYHDVPNKYIVAENSFPLIKEFLVDNGFFLPPSKLNLQKCRNFYEVATEDVVTIKLNVSLPLTTSTLSTMIPGTPVFLKVKRNSELEDLASDPSSLDKKNPRSYSMKIPFVKLLLLTLTHSIQGILGI